jgi:RNA polymerase sigma-70 factor (ECF subfamily)
MNPSDSVTALLTEMDHGNPDAISELMPLIYAELRQIAASHVNRERRGHTMQASDLLQEACLRLVKPDSGPWKSRHHFFAIASRSMRQVLVDYARAHGAKKRRGVRASIDLTNAAVYAPEGSATILAVDEALKRLAKLSERQSRLVELRFFSGLTVRESAAVLGVGVTTVKEEWALAKAWLQRELRKPR